MAKTPMLGDCHTHLDNYGSQEMPEILERAREAGVAFVVLAGTTVESTRSCIEMSGQHDMLYAGVGIHPMHADSLIEEGTYRELEG